MKSFSFRLQLPDRSLLRQIAVFTLLSVFCTHAFAFFNLTYSGESVMIDAGNAMHAQIESGQFLQAIYFRLRGGIASPLIVGLISTFFLFLSLTLTASMLDLRSMALRFALCACVCVHPSVTAVFAVRMHTADALFIALFLAAAGVWLCRRFRFGWVPGAAFLCAAMAMEADASSVSAGLILLCTCRDWLDSSSGRHAMYGFLQSCAAFILSCVLYAVGHTVMVDLLHASSSASLHVPKSLWEAWIYPLRMLFSPLTAYPQISVLLHAVLLLLLPVQLILLKKLNLRHRLLVFLAAFLFPLVVNLPVYSQQGPGQVRLAYALISVLILLLVQQTPCQPLHRGVCAVFSVLLVSSVIFSNQVYLKKNLEFEATLSRMTRVIDRAEDTPGFIPGHTPAAVLGNLDQSSISQTLKGFEHLAVFDAAAPNSAVNTKEDMVWYMWEILGYPINLVSSYEHTLLAENEFVKSMPSFPAEGCCQFVGDTLVIKLSD